MYRITLENIFNTPNACLEYQVFDIHLSIIDHHWEHKMWCDAIWLLKSVIPDTNTSQMAILQIHVWVKNAGVGVSKFTAETMGIWQDTGGLTTEWIVNEVRECVWVITQSMSIIKMQGTGPKQWDLLINLYITRISDGASTRPPWKQYMADKTNLNGQKLKTALDEYLEVGLCWMTNWLKYTPPKMWNLVHVGMYFIAPMLCFLPLMMCRYRRRWGRNHGSQVFAD